MRSVGDWKPWIPAIAVLLATAAGSAGTALALEPAGGQQEEQQEEGQPQRRGRGEPGVKPYAEVITEEAETRAGVFKTHRVGETFYYEIPEAELGRDFVWVTQIARTQTSYGYGGLQAQNRVVGNRVRGRQRPVQ